MAGEKLYKGNRVTIYMYSTYLVLASDTLSHKERAQGDA